MHLITYEGCVRGVGSTLLTQASYIRPQSPAACGVGTTRKTFAHPQTSPDYQALSYILTSKHGSDFILQLHRFLTKLEDLGTVA